MFLLRMYFENMNKRQFPANLFLVTKEVSIRKLLYSAGSATDLIGRFIVLNRFIAITPSFRILNGFLSIPVALEVSQFLISFTTFSNGAIWSLNFTLSFACLLKLIRCLQPNLYPLIFAFFSGAISLKSEATTGCVLLKKEFRPPILLKRDPNTGV